MSDLSGFGLLLVDDHALFRDGFVLALNTLAPGCDVLAVATQDDARRALQAQSERFDLVLVDYKLADGNGLACAAELRANHPMLSVGLLSGESDADLPAQARAAGLVAFLSKSLAMSALMESLTQLAQGQSVFYSLAPSAGGAPLALDFGLTPRQHDVLRCLAMGDSNKAIAQSMNISPATVKHHLEAIFEKMGVTNRMQAVILARAAIGNIDAADSPSSP